MIELVAEFPQEVRRRVSYDLRGSLVREGEPAVHRVTRHKLHPSVAQAAF